MPLDPVWEEIVRGALEQATRSSREPIPGAKLRELIAKRAQEKGLQFPPPETPAIKFGDFIDKFSTVVAVRRRPGQDILVAPADRPEILLVPLERSVAGVRNDLFRGFTQFSDSVRPWYAPGEDKVYWRKLDASPDNEDWKEIPRTSLDQAVGDRRNFADFLGDDVLKTELQSALEGPRPLVDFSNVVRAKGLQPAWHHYRTKLVVDRIADWAKRFGIQWREDWITSSASGTPTLVKAAANEGESSREWRNALYALIQTLEQDDLTRVNIPLDIVLKALQVRR